MSRFTESTEIPVSLDDESVPYQERDIVWIKSKMDVGTRRSVRKALTTMTVNANGTMQMALDLAGQNVALLEYNITRWQGPGFDGIPFTREALARIDPDDPLLDKALAEINRRNGPVAAEDAVSSPNSVNGGGQSSVVPSPPVKMPENTTSTSS